MQCPIIESTPEFQSDQAAMTAELKEYISLLKSFRVCAMEVDMRCHDTLDDGTTVVPEPLDNFLCLNCSHFVHPACAASHLRNVLGEMKQNLQHATCYRCERDRQPCDCTECCTGRPDRPASLAHIITQAEVGHLVKCGSLRFVSVAADLNAFPREKRFA